MLLSSIIKDLLIKQGIPHQRVHSAVPDNVDKAHASISLLKDSEGIVMAIYNNGHQLDLLTLKALVERPELRFMSLQELSETHNSIKELKLKPFSKSPSRKAGEFNIQLIINEPLSNKSTVLLVTDNPEERLQVDIWEMQIMIENALIGGIFSHTHHVQSNSTGKMKSNLLARLKNIDHLPVMPSISADLLKLQANPDATVDDMVKIISHDPALTAQILRYANSSLFAFSGQISNLHDAIFRVLGYETVLYMSFGGALGRAFKLPQTGRLSMHTFWKEATYRAALCQQLALRIPRESRPSTSIAYITGLLHNIGIVIMGNLFQSEFNWLNKMLTNRPEQALITTEQNLFTCSHTTIGQHLMLHWNMPEEISTVVGEHHTPNYTGKHEIYVWLTQLAGQVLKEHDLSDADEEIDQAELCRRLELNKENVKEAIAAIMEENTALDAIANTLCA
ncbi:MAG: HDOD domain-containing protein [Gammaproteobacteria bacterium]|nr:HDOD domain-containing protein [Gammaproteobacteria bacterium]